LIEYKNEAFVMFNELTEAIQAEIVTSMFYRVQVTPQEPAPVPQRVDRRGARPTGPSQPAGSNGGGGEALPVGAGAAKVGRNDPCPCGSGLKYKKCHGR